MAYRRRGKLIQCVRVKTYRKRPHGRTKSTWEDNIKMTSGILKGECGLGSYGSRCGSISGG